ncbi:MAG: peptide-methionine (S)-S-oxide reductase MsrA [Gemmatimonadales bacterium]
MPAFSLPPLAIILAAATAAPAPTPIRPLPLSAGPVATRDTAVFAGGCFWGIQAVFARVKGVLSATAGYAGARKADPSYEEVSTGTTGYAESVQVIYDPAKVSYDQLLAVFFTVHDPTELNRQGPDDGTQYRSAVFYRNPAQQRAAAIYIAKLVQGHAYRHAIATQIAPVNSFHRAEEYHQDFYDKNPDYPYIVINDKPKVAQLKSTFPQLFTPTPAPST